MAQNRELGELGQFLTVNTASNTILVNAVSIAVGNTVINSTSISMTTITANGSVGTNGQTLLSNGTSAYWANAVIKVYDEANNQVFP